LGTKVNIVNVFNYESPTELFDVLLLKHVLLIVLTNIIFDSFELNEVYVWSSIFLHIH